MDSCIKEKRKQIEFDLPRFVYAISQEIQMSHDVISILERHKDNFSPYLNEEIEITIADMRTGNYEAAIIAETVPPEYRAENSAKGTQAVFLPDDEHDVTICCGAWLGASQQHGRSVRLRRVHE